MKLSILFETANDSTYAGFNNWIKQTGQDPKKIIQSLMKNSPDHVGGNANFWYIPDSVFGLLVQRAGLKKAGVGDASDPGDIFPDLNVGQPIAQFGPNISIVRLQKGSPGGMKHRYNRLPKEEQSQEAQKYKGKLKQCANLPIEAYHKMFRDIKTIMSKGKVIDPSKPGNLLISDTGFGFVDLNSMDVTSSSGYKWKDLIGPWVVHMFVQFAEFKKFLVNDPEAVKYAADVVLKIDASAKAAGFSDPSGLASTKSVYVMLGLAGETPTAPKPVENINANDVW